ncbi:MAG: hypothetical protein HHAS10_03650 [Candidatus Altimarinota bacterium]
MYKTLRQNIRVFFDARETGSEGLRDKTQDRNDEEIRAKKFSEALTTALESEKNTEKWKTIYEDFLREIKKQLGEKYVGSRFEVHLGALRQHLFTKEQTIKPRAREELQAFKKSFQLNQESGPKPEVKKFLESFPLEHFKDTIFKQAVLHPINSKTGLFPSEYKTLKATVVKLGKDLPAEYLAVIQTSENIMASPEFRNNTGSIDTTIQKILGQAKSVEEFQKNLKKFLDMAAMQKKALSIDDFRVMFDVNRPLSEAETKVAQEYMKKVGTALLAAKGNRAQSLGIIREYSNALELQKDKFAPVVYTRLQALLAGCRSDISRAGDDTLESTIGDFIRSIGGSVGGKKTEEIRTRENYQKAKDEALKKTMATGEPHMAHWNEGKYEIISLKEIGNIIRTDIRKINATLFRSLFEGGGESWKAIADSLDPMSRSAIGAYIENNPTTQLFQGVPPQVKELFLQSYHDTVSEQNRIMKEKNINGFSGKFEEIFPVLHSTYKEIGTDIQAQKSLQEGRMGDFYNSLVVKGLNNGRVKEIMDAIKKDMGNLRTISTQRAVEQSIQWKGKTFESAKGEFDLKEKDKAFFDKIKGRRIEIDNLSSEERKRLLTLIRPESKLKPLLEAIQTNENAAKMGAAATTMSKMAGKKPQTQAASQLDGNMTAQVENASRLAGARANQDIHRKLVQQHVSPNDLELNQQITEQTRRDAINVASSVVAYIETPGIDRGEAQEFIGQLLPNNFTKKDINIWIDSQIFLHKYEYEKNFRDPTEIRAAYMNTDSVKPIQQIVSGSKVDISEIPPGSTLKIGETTLSGNSISGIGELMNCSIVAGDNNVFSRNIVSPKGDIILRDVPLESLKPCINQLSRYYLLGIGPLAPYMNLMSGTISSTRPDSIGGFNGDYTTKEDQVFLKSVTSLIYGKGALPEESTSENYVRIFHSTNPENNPIRKLKGLGILRDDGSVDSLTLQDLLKKAASSL